MSGMDIKDGRLVLLGAHDGNAMDSVQAGEIAAMARELLAHRRASQAAPAEEWEACTCGPCPLHPAAPTPSDGLREAVEAERERIAVALEAEADLLPCAEDAAVTRSNAALIRADFGYEDADRAALTPAPAQEGGE